MAVEPNTLPAVIDGIAQVYAAAFAEPPYDEGEEEVERARQALASHARRQGFRLFVAKNEAGQIVGFAYGYHGQPGQWWHDFVSRLMTPETRYEWLTDCFELVELAVAPDQQGKGIGGRLHDALLAAAPYRTAVLSTYSGENRAMALYKGRGWKTLVNDLTFPGSHIPMVVLGRELQRQEEKI